MKLEKQLDNIESAIEELGKSVYETRRRVRDTKGNLSTYEVSNYYNYLVQESVNSS